MRQHILRVHASAPEGQRVAKVPFQFRGVHVFRTRVHGVQNVHARLDPAGQERPHIAAGMEEQLRLRRGPLNRGEDPHQVRMDCAPVLLIRDNLRQLRAVVVVFNHDIHRVPQLRQRHLPEGNLEVGERSVEPVGHLGVDERVGKRVLHAAQALRHLEDARAQPFHQDALTRRAKGLRLRAQPGHPRGVRRRRPFVRIDGFRRGRGILERLPHHGEPVPALREMLRHPPLVVIAPVVPHVHQLLVHIPVVAGQRKHAARVDAEALENVVVRRHHLLHHVQPLGRLRFEAQMRPQVVAGHASDGGNMRAAEVAGRAVGFPVGEGGQNAFSGLHVASGVSLVHQPATGA